jgi:hypothetical protein
VLGVGDHAGDLAQFGLAGERVSRAQEHGDGAEPVQRGHGGERARAGAHEHPDVVAAAHADRDQPCARGCRSGG